MKNVTFGKAIFKDNMFVAKIPDYQIVHFDDTNFTCRINFSKISSIGAGEFAFRILFAMPTSQNKSMVVPLSGFKNIPLTKDGSKTSHYIGDITIYLLKERERQETVETHSYGYGSSSGSINIIDYHYPKKVVIKNNIEKTYEDLRKLFPSIPFQKTLMESAKFEVKEDG